jgi:hypothetical protein
MNIVTASNDKTFDLESLAQSFSYNEDGTLHYIEVEYRDNTYRQTYTYNGNGQVTSISRWVRQ